MASMSDEENIHQEETGRRTRSGRKVTAPTTPAQARTPRRSNRRQTTDQMNEVATDSRIKPVGEDTFLQSEIIQEMLAEAAQGVLVHSTESEDLVTTTMPATYETDIINDNEDVHEDVQEEIITNMEMVEQEVDGEEIVFVTETQETDDIIMETQGSEYVVLTSQEEEEEEMYANTQESDGNYIQVTGTEEVILQSQGTEEGVVPHTQEMEKIIIHRQEQEQEPEEIIINTQEPEENITQTEDDKSSSFPFGNIPASENSDGKTEEIVVSNITDCVDSSLLASLVGDNANSLPSAGEESQSKDNFENTESTKDTGMKLTLETDDTHSQPAIAEDLQNGGDGESERTGADVDAEMVSEDEFPTRVQPKVTDAEEVSDDELPAPTRAELPADTEVVSEDELPSSTKKELNKRKASEGYDPGSPTEESVEVPEKKTKLTSEEKEEAKEKKKEKEKRKLPELEKYWNAVNDDPADFTGWTYLLQYVDQENDIEAAREAYDAFLAHYPYCYGYWRKYADYEKRKGNKKKCEEVFERGLKAIPLSVDLWIHYLTHVKTNFVDNEEYVRSQFERALSACGLEFRSDKLWEAFIKWEMEAKRYSKVLKIYDRLLKTPTQGYSGHFDSFQDLINNQSISSIISVEEFKKIRSEIRESEKTGDKEITVDEEDEADDHVRNDEEATAIKDKIIALRRKVHKATVSAVTARWTFEEGIKRPYFHVKPLERCQLKNWNEYLDYEIERGDRKRVLILFERCLIACALYDEFWLKLIRYLELQNDLDLIPATRDAFDRACTIHHPDKPSLHLMWSAFEECQNNFNKAAEILVNVEKIAPNLLQIAYRRINLERRRGDFEKCKELYEYYISQAKNKNIAGSLAIKYARFCHKIMEDLEAGLNVLRLTLEKDPANTRVALQMIDLALQRHQVNEEEVVEIMDKFMSRDGMEPDQKVLFAQRKVEFLEDFGSTAKGLQDAQRALHIALNKANESKKKSESSPSKKSTSKDTTPPASVSNSATSAYNNGSYGYGSSTNSNYYGNNQSYPSYDSYGYNHWQQQYGTGYSGGYSQWSGYGNYY